MSAASETGKSGRAQIATPESLNLTAQQRLDLAELGVDGAIHLITSRSWAKPRLTWLRTVARRQFRMPAMTHGISMRRSRRQGCRSGFEYRCFEGLHAEMDR